MSDGININNDITGDYENISEEVNIDLNEDYKINWDAPTQEEDAVQIEETAEVSLGEPAESSEEVADEVRESEDGEHDDEVQEEDGGVELGQVWEEDSDEEYASEEDDEYEDEYEADDESESLGEEWDALFQFIEDNPGSTPEDYFGLKSLGEGMDEGDKLRLHLANEHGLDVEDDADEIDFLYEDTFGFDEDLDSERDIRMKKIAAKKALKEADATIEELKSQYGGDLTFSNQPEEVQEALSFHKEQNEMIQQNQQLADDFQANTKDYFTKEFKGFEFEYGDGRSQRIKANGQKLAEDQSDISNFIEKFMGDDGTIDDLNGYHKALWAANNADALFSHAYEQGKADAVRTARKTAKNIDMDPRQDSSAEEVTSQGRFKLLDNDEDDFKFSF